MKKTILTLLCFSFFTTVATSQIHFGAGLTFLNNLGVQVRADLPLVNSFDFEPKLSYYFVDNATNLSLDLDATYNLLNFGDDNPLYVLAGPMLYSSSTGGDSDSNFGFNLGAGLSISNIYFELKYTTIIRTGSNGQIGGNLAYMF